MAVEAARGAIYLDHDGRWRLAVEDPDGIEIFTVDLPATVTTEAGALAAGESDLAAFGYRAGALSELDDHVWEFALLPYA